MLNLINKCGALLLVLYCSYSCNKKEFLDKIPFSTILVPKTLDDFQALLDNHAIFSEMPVLGELSADNYYLLPHYWQSLKNYERAAYIWQPDIFGTDEHIGDWERPYQQVDRKSVV